jgi:hypothetical protein
MMVCSDMISPARFGKEYGNSSELGVEPVEHRLRASQMGSLPHARTFMRQGMSGGRSNGG